MTGEEIRALLLALLAQFKKHHPEVDYETGHRLICEHDYSKRDTTKDILIALDCLKRDAAKPGSHVFERSMYYILECIDMDNKTVLPDTHPMRALHKREALEKMKKKRKSTVRALFRRGVSLPIEFYTKWNR